MNRRTLLWSVYPYYLIIIIISLALTALVASWEMRQMHLDDMANALEVRAGFVGRELENTLLRRDDPAIDRHCKEFGRLSHARITVIDAAGVVLGDSEQDPGTMENHRTRPEIAQALAGNTGMETRFSNTFQTTMMYVAVPVIAEGRIIGVVRTSSPITEIERTLHILYRRLLISGLIIPLWPPLSVCCCFDELAA